jgi:hypothetical protein
MSLASSYSWAMRRTGQASRGCGLVGVRAERKRDLEAWLRRSCRAGEPKLWEEARQQQRGAR